MGTLRQSYVHGASTVPLIGSTIGVHFDEAAAPFDRASLSVRTVLAVTGVLTIFLFAYPGPFVEAATAAAKSLF